MQRTFFKSKIHRAAITDANLHYEGSLSIDSDIMKAADILPFEKVDLVNIHNGVRLTTYAIEAESGSKEIGLNGGAARLGQIGDRVIIITYAQLEPQEIDHHRATVVLLDENNNIVTINHKTVR